MLDSITRAKSRDAEIIRQVATDVAALEPYEGKPGEWRAEVYARNGSIFRALGGSPMEALANARRERAEILAWWREQDRAGNGRIACEHLCVTVNAIGWAVVNTRKRNRPICWQGDQYARRHAYRKAAALNSIAADQAAAYARRSA